jgi:hypothetical protein
MIATTVATIAPVEIRISSSADGFVDGPYQVCQVFLCRKVY